MTGRERVQRLLGGKRGDRPPMGEILFTKEFVESCRLNNLHDAVDFFNSDIMTLPVISTSAHGWKKWRCGSSFLMGSFSGPFSALIEYHGWKEASRMIVKNETKAIEFMGEYLENGVAEIVEAGKAGCEAILLADDIAGGSGPFVSPRFLIECYFSLLSEYLKKKIFRNIPFFFHSDGNILKLIPHVKSAGFKGIQGLQPSVGISPDKFNPEDYREFIFWGNFEFEGDQGLKNLSQLKTEVKSTLKSWDKFNYIFGSSGGIYENLKHEAAKAVCDQVAVYGE